MYRMVEFYTAASLLYLYIIEPPSIDLTVVTEQGILVCSIQTIQDWVLKEPIEWILSDRSNPNEMGRF